MFCKQIHEDKMLIADSVAVKVNNSQEVFIGVGNHLKYVKFENGERNVQWFDTQFRGKILGIEIVRDTLGCFVLVHGGRYLAVFELVEGSLQRLSGCQFSDLISSVHCENDLSNICVITGHNIALLVNFRESLEVTKKAKCEDNSTLYCSHVEGAKWEDFVVYSGTALGDVILWKPSDIQAGILHRFTAHKGVVFSIETDKNLLVTTSDDRSARIWRKDKLNGSSLVSLYGHKSRVFKSKIIEKNGLKFILTIGEDSNLCVWHESGKFLFRKTLFSGAVIWNLDHDPNTDTVFTSGSDGNVKKINLKEILEKGITEIPRKPLLDEKISKILFLDSETILVIASEMFLLKQEISGEWKPSKKIPIPEIYISLIENVNGNILICSNHEARILQISSGIPQEEIRNANLLEGLIRTFYLIAPGEFFFVDDRGNCAITNKSLKVLNQFSISICKDLWYTKWITVARKFGEFLLLGDRSGNLHLWRVLAGEIIKKCEVRSVHGNLGVTQVFPEEDSEISARFWTSGRDGILRKFHFDKFHESFNEIFTEKVPITWVERIIQLKTGQKVILGFNDENLVAWDRNQGIIFQLCTGGGHKYWDFAINPAQDCASVLSVWDKQPFLDKFSLPETNFQEIPCHNWHSKSCNSVEILKDNSGKFGKPLLISGGDDNVLRINFLGNELIPVSEVVPHISNIRAIKVKNLQENIFLAISVGGRAQICLTKILLNDKPEVQEYLNFMLKSKDFRKNRQKIDFCPETRFMCLTIDEIDIFIGCSDGYIRKFTLQNEKISLVSSVFYGRCILNIQIIEYLDNKVLITMGTDGKIILWDTKNFLEDSLPIYSILHHESGINCFDIWAEDGKFTLLTGGDDQKITKSVFHFENGRVIQDETPKTAFLHFAQVTGIKIANPDTFYSTSVDQRVIKGNLHKLTSESERFTSVSDLKGLNLLSDREVLVFGAGVESIEF
ncbi:WD repeat-containing protein 6 [Phlebotomus papatasi]|uniref:WD repeat-containing protein 6 n=1 Tax=Phlebotomus papatasi TaxID=29031 RepID=UPI0024842C14|nr:WD repeat-containing protein 6 [Phlebotomus papatasi]